jgi:hypothetical protein
MNPIIKKQLQSCRVANIPVFEDSDPVISIPKGSIMNITPYQIGKCYIVELQDFVLNPSENSIITDNWNKGSIPRHKYYKCEIVNVMGKMVNIFGCGYDPLHQVDSPDLWQGWVPQSGIKLLKQL